MKFYCYPKCSTCKAAASWLNQQGYSNEYINIRQDPPTADQLKQLHALSGLELKRFFNTSGNSYRALGLAGKLDNIPQPQQYDMLSRDGMLLKRPIIATNDTVLVGFQPEIWEKELTKEES